MHALQSQNAFQRRVFRLAWCMVVIGATNVLGDGPDTIYTKQIRPILHERCVACHGGLKQEAGLRLDTAAGALQGGDSGPSIEAHQPDASLIVQRVSSNDPGFRMPPEGDPLHPPQIELLKGWIQLGAIHPADEIGETDPNHHWAFLPPVQADLPRSSLAQWNGNPIDAWIASGRERLGLGHQQPSPKSVWLRRVTLDLIGLPPTPDEIAAFVMDTLPDARMRVVERLLQSPHYGERWGRHWMDIWRYSDWWGLGEEVRNSQKHMWHWRDWIIESLNEDKGYDQMVREMLAADELYPNDFRRLRATGYLARQYFKFNRTSWMDETIEHTAKGMLGLTFNCAKCHDHKYDPLSQEDYYRFRALFEPYQVRMEMVQGESDFARDGMPRAFDCNLDTTTYLHIRGDDRNPDPSKVMEPSVPKFLGGPSLHVRSVLLPLESSTPGLRPHVFEALRDAARTKVHQWKTKGTELQGRILTAIEANDATARASHQRELELAVLEHQRALSELLSLEWRYRADLARHYHAEDPATPECIRRAARADRRVEVADAKVLHARALSVLETASAETVAEAKAQLQSAESKLETAMKQLDAPGDQYRKLRGAEKTAESNLENEESRSKPFPTTSTGRRSALAAWMTDRSNPLLARVAVNHVWARHFGSPLVPTVFDFGRKGVPPVHQELLDYLAVELMENHWSIKHLHRLMTTSETYAMGSTVLGVEESTQQTDPENRYFWRMNSQRMEAQSVRDSLLMLSGELDRSLGGPSIPTSDTTSRRRSLYYFQSHNEHEKFLAIFDDANVLDCYRRARSIVPQQALALQNSPLVQSACEKIVARILGEELGMDDEPFIRKAFVTLLAMEARPAEIHVAQTAMEQWRTSARLRSADADFLARCGLIRSLVNHNDFVVIR